MPNAKAPKLPKAQTPVPAVSKRGRNYSDAEIEKLLDLAEEMLPCGGDEWNQVALEFNRTFKATGSNREGEDLRLKFKKLKNHKKPTGDPDCPPHVKRSKQIQRQIERRMDVVHLDDDDKSQDDAGGSSSEDEIIHDAEEIAEGAGSQASGAPDATIKKNAKKIRVELLPDPV